MYNVYNVIKMLACGLEVMVYATHRCSNTACCHQKKVCFSCKSNLQKQAFGIDPLLCILCRRPMVFHRITPGKPFREIRHLHEALAFAKIVA
jgi:hypothetical protein